MNSKAEIKKPPDIETIYDNIDDQVYRTIKCPLKTVLKNYDIIHPIINNLVIDITPFSLKNGTLLSKKNVIAPTRA